MSERTSQLARLAAPFKSNLVHKPAKGKYGSYVSHDSVTQKLLAVCGAYDFSVDQVIRGSSGDIEAVLATLTLTIDGEKHSVTEVGECEQPDNWKTEGARLKDAISDAIKRCAMRFGVALHLWAQTKDENGNPVSTYFLYDYLRPKDACVECGHKNEPEPQGNGKADTRREGLATAKAALQGQLGATEQ